jgi:hypothetical protein
MKGFSGMSMGERDRRGGRASARGVGELRRAIRRAGPPSIGSEHFDVRIARRLAAQGGTRPNDTKGRDPDASLTLAVEM